MEDYSPEELEYRRELLLVTVTYSPLESNKNRPRLR